MRRMLHRLFFLMYLSLWLGLAMAAAITSQADLVVFYNGDFRYGDVVKTATGAVQYVSDTITINYPNGESENYHRRNIRGVHLGIDRPKLGERVEVGDFVQASTAEIFQVTGDITHSQTVHNTDGKTFQLDVQNDYAVPAMRLFPTRYSFFNRPGVYLVLRLQNATDQTQHSLTFRVYVYNQQNQLIATKDFLINRLPPTTPEGRGGRVVEVDVPDVLYENIARIRVVRRY